ncbi:MAG: serine/threonine protein kinase [Cocleimonas sp.]|nr:serine/threonine protein kinase [Cocleimonas sp.]
MTPNSLDEIEQLFEAVLLLPKGECTAYLKSQTSSKEIINEVLELLQAHNDLGGFLTEPLSIEDDFILICPDLSGRLVNVWQVSHQIGQGGMGRVYLAHRADGEYEQTVAFKVVEYKAFNNAAFLKERQILADLEHPNIVSLLDAGTLQEGYPYLIMEYIDGLSIDDWVKQSKELTSEERILLFVKLCKVVQSAHDHGIIHCDLKPSNIYISNDGALKLLDFGIAQSLHDVNATKSDKAESFSFTPEYSSPNRHQHKFPTIQDDIFSLGIIFAQLLTGKTPIMQRSDEIAQPDSKAIAKQIDDIELQAMFLAMTGANNSATHYRSMAELIDDFGFYQNNFPLKALGDNFTYRAKKHLQRNWRRWLSALVIISLLITGGVRHWKTQKIKKDSELIREILSAQVSDTDASLEQQSGMTPTRKKLMMSMVQQLEKLVKNSSNNIQLTKMLADTYNRLGVVTGSPYVLSMGNIPESRRYQYKALALYEKIQRQRKDSLAAHNDISRVKREIAKLYAADNDTKRMREYYAETLQEMEKAYRDQPLKKQHTLAIVYIVGAHGEMHLGNLKYSQQLLDQATKILQALDVREHKVNYEIETRFIKEETAHILLLKSDLNAAKAIYTALLEKKLKNNHWRLVRSHVRVNTALGCIYLQKQQQQIALQYFKQARKFATKLSNKYPAVESLSKALQHYETLDKASSEELSSIMFCTEPRKFMMPLTRR